MLFGYANSQYCILQNIQKRDSVDTPVIETGTFRNLHWMQSGCYTTKLHAQR
jgi:hypothetical protein